MKLFITAIFIIGANIYLLGQSSIAECSIAKKKAMDSFYQKAKNKDMAAARQIISRLEPDLSKCLLGKSIEGLPFTTRKGQVLDDKNLKGKVVVINFWFTGCTPCILEMPALNKLVSQYKDSPVVFIGVTYDNKERLTPFLEKMKFDFTIVGDSRNITDLFGVNAYPTTIIMDQNLLIKKVWIGAGDNEKTDTEAYEGAKSIIDELFIVK